MFEKLVSFTKDVSDLADQPALGSAAALKAHFDAAPDEVRQYLNKLIDALKKTESGDSGAKNIGATSISGLTGTDVQALLESLNTLKAEKAQETTFNLALIGATASQGRGIRVFKDSLGLVHVNMDFDLPSDTTSTYHVATLPAGYRPAVKVSQNISALNRAATAAGFGEIDINTDGTIILGAPKVSAWSYIHVNIPPYKAV